MRSKVMMHLGTFQYIQDIFLLTHQLTISYSKMDQQYINVLHAPNLDIGLYGTQFKQETEIIYEIEMSSTHGVQSHLKFSKI